MQFSAQQQKAYDKIGCFLKSNNRVFALAGYAGTGKTTLANAISKQVNGQTIFCAFTGKAALALRKKGCAAETIHSLLYNVASKSDGVLADLRERLKTCNDPQEILRLTKEIKAESERLKQPRFSLKPKEHFQKAELVIVDEYSMLTEALYNDILHSTNAKIIMLGDLGQLPPIGKTADIPPDYFLDEVHRQALDSPILRAATFVRCNGELPEDINTLEFSIKSKNECGWEDYKNTDQVIVGKNKTRHFFNKRFREKLQLSHKLLPKIPVKGDKLICLKNNPLNGLYNGTIGYATVDTSVIENDIGFINFKEADSDTELDLQIYLPRFLKDETPDWMDAKNRGFEDMDYGYAITCHKAQGSEWGSVLVFDENFGKTEAERARWLYTAITRASDKCLIVKGA